MAEVEFVLPEPVPVTVQCDIHPWEKAYWLVVDHPFAAKTEANGSFEIKNVPFGRHVFRVWHERIGYVEKELEITVDAPVIQLSDFVMTADQLKRRAQRRLAKP